MSRLAAAKGIVAQRMLVDRATWTHAQQTALWLLERGEAGDDMADTDEIVGELVDWDEPDDPREDEADDFTVDDRDVSVGPPFGYDWESGQYYVEANSGPGWVRPD